MHYKLEQVLKLLALKISAVNEIIEFLRDLQTFKRETRAGNFRQQLSFCFMSWTILEWLFYLSFSGFHLNNTRCTVMFV